MEVTINGERWSIPDNLTLEGLLYHMKLDPSRVAVEHNREIIKRDQWSAVKVQPGDQVEIVHMVGGG